MISISPKKLLNSKWTATKSSRKEKHFLVVEVEYDEDSYVVRCLIEAVMTKRQTEIQWRDLNDTSQWLMGWK